MIPYGVVEKNGILRDHSNGFPNRCLSDSLDVLVINKNGPRLDVVESEEQSDNCALA